MFIITSRTEPSFRHTGRSPQTQSPVWAATTSPRCFIRSLRTRPIHITQTSQSHPTTGKQGSSGKTETGRNSMIPYQNLKRNTDGVLNRVLRHIQNIPTPQRSPSMWKPSRSILNSQLTILNSIPAFIVHYSSFPFYPGILSKRLFFAPSLLCAFALNFFQVNG